MAIIINACK